MNKPPTEETKEQRVARLLKRMPPEIFYDPQKRIAALKKAIAAEEAVKAAA